MYYKSMITKDDVNLLPCDRGNNNNEHPGIVKSNKGTHIEKLR
jgi:hypothetical protein